LFEEIFGEGGVVIEEAGLSDRVAHIKMDAAEGGAVDGFNQLPGRTRRDPRRARGPLISRANRVRLGLTAS
jgi:hypothetical protein